jgi:hypothetical protein
MVFFPFLKLLVTHSASLDWRDRSSVKIAKEVGFRRTFTGSSLRLSSPGTWVQDPDRLRVSLESAFIVRFEEPLSAVDDGFRALASSTESAKASVFKCPANGCGRQAKLVCIAVLEFIHPVGGEKAAYYIVECAKPGEKLITLDLQPVIHQNRDPNRRRRTPVNVTYAAVVSAASACNGKN